MENTFELFEKGKLYTETDLEANDSKSWYAHAKFKGVFLKNIIVGNQTDGKFSAHLVKVEPGCILDEHIHPGVTELHEVINGSGNFYLNNKEATYKTGDYAIIPNDTKHKVVAGEKGLCLFAKFFPALS